LSSLKLAKSPLSCSNIVQMTTRDSKNIGLLQVETISGRVLFEGQALPKVTPHWAYIYGLLALRHFEKIHEISSDEIALLPTWINVSIPGIASSLFRHNTKMRKLGFDLVVSPEREHTKRFLFNSNRVKKVKCDVGSKELRVWLNLETKHQSGVPTNYRVSMKLELARVIFEKGRYSEVESICREVLALPGCFDDKLMALAQIAWVKAYIATRAESLRAIQELQDSLAAFKTTPSVDLVSPNIEARVWIQVARHYWRHREPNAAVKALDRAEKLLLPNDNMEWAGIHTARSFLAQNAGKLDQAAIHNLEAFACATRAQWRLSMGAQATNRSAILMAMYHRDKTTDQILAKEHLLEAVQWLMLSVELADEVDISGSADAEINLMLIHTWLGQLDEARIWLAKAERLVKAAKQTQDKAELNYEAAELEIATGNSVAAFERLELAIRLYEELGMRVQLKAAKKRLIVFKSRYSA
jgi:tetratricopeptide (TPR) repeat protein